MLVYPVAELALSGFVIEIPLRFSPSDYPRPEAESFSKCRTIFWRAGGKLIRSARIGAVASRILGAAWHGVNRIIPEFWNGCA